MINVLVGCITTIVIIAACGLMGYVVRRVFGWTEEQHHPAAEILLTVILGAVFFLLGAVLTSQGRF